MDALVRRLRRRPQPLLDAARAGGQAAARGPRSRSARRPRRPGRRPCRRRRRTAACARRRRPRSCGGGGRCRCSRRARRRAASARLTRGRESTVHVGELAVADPHAVAAVQRLRPGHELLVEVGAVRRAEVLEHDDPAVAQQLRVAAGRERVLEPDLGLVAAPERRRPRRCRTPFPACARARARRSAAASAAGRRGVRDRRRRSGRRRHERGARLVGPAQVAQRRARDPEHEQVEHGEEARPGGPPRSARASLDLEPGADGAELDAVAGGERLRALHARAVDAARRSSSRDPRSSSRPRR